MKRSFLKINFFTASDGEGSSMGWRVLRITNPKGWQRVAGGRSATATSGRAGDLLGHPGGMPELCDSCGVDGRLWPAVRGFAALNPRLISGQPAACFRNHSILVKRAAKSLPVFTVLLWTWRNGLLSWRWQRNQRSLIMMIYVSSKILADLSSSS